MKSNREEPPFPLTMDGGKIARNTFLNFAGNALPLAVGIVTIPFIIRWLGTDRFGILSLAWVVIGYFGFFDLGLGRSTTKFVAEALGKGEPEKVPGYFWTTVIFQAFLGLLGALVLALTTPFLVERILKAPPALFDTTKATFYILAISVPVVLVSASFRGVLEAGQRFDLVNYVKIPSSAVNYLMPMAGVFLGFGLPGIMILLVGSRILTLVAWIVICMEVVPGLRSKIALQKETIRPLLAFGGWITVSNIVGPLLIYVDRFFIGAIQGITAVGYYSAPYELISRLGIVPGSLLMTLFPAFSALDGGNDRETAILFFERSVKFLLLLMGTVVMILVFFAGDFLAVWLGGAFAAQSTPVFRILAVGFFFNALASVPYSYLQGIGRADLTAKFHIGEVLFYIPLTWMLVDRLGIVGAAYAWMVRVIADAVLLFWASGKFGKVGFFWASRNSGLGALVLIAALGTVGLMITRSPWRYGGFAILLTILVYLAWARALSALEKRWLMGTWRRVFRRGVAS
jgi:O-antigen/teichoic acid export membrane protein